MRYLVGSLLLIAAVCSASCRSPQNHPPRPDADDDGLPADGDGNALQGDGCEVYSCASVPLCALGCVPPCGCCPCTAETEACAIEGGNEVSYVCDVGATCLEAVPCVLGRCELTAAGAGCVRTRYRLGGTIAGCEGDLTLGIVEYAVSPPAPPPIEETFVTTGPFTFSATFSPDTHLGLYVAAKPAHQKCVVDPVDYWIVDADVLNAQITCEDASPCVASGYQCFVGSCPYSPLLSETVALSCALDGSPTPGSTCCRLIE